MMATKRKLQRMLQAADALWVGPCQVKRLLPFAEGACIVWRWSGNHEPDDLLSHDGTWRYGGGEWDSGYFRGHFPEECVFDTIELAWDALQAVLEAERTEGGRVVGAKQEQAGDSPP